MFCVILMRRPRTLRSVLLLWYLAVFAVSATVLVLFAYMAAAHQMRREVDKFLEDEIREYESFAVRAKGDLAALRRDLRHEVASKRYFRMFCRILDARTAQVLLTEPEAFHTVTVDPESVRRAGRGGKLLSTVHVRSEAKTRHYRVVTIPVGPDRPARYVIQTGMRLRRLQKRIQRLRRYLAAAIPVMLAFALAGGWFLSGRSLQPMKEVVRRLGEIRSGDLSQRLPPREANDELGWLVSAINTMLDELEDAFERVRAFSADAAHELRTPVATLRCQAEVALDQSRDLSEYQEVLQSVVERCAALSRVLDNLLFLAQTSSEEALPERARVDLHDVIEELREPFDILAEEKTIRLALDASPGAVVWGNEAWLRTLMANLLNNALKFTPGRGSVSAMVVVRDQNVVLEVRDTGVGIPESEQMRIFEPFHRGDPSRSRETGGAGLGLSICRRIAERHGGEISVESRPGKGSTFTVKLPLASDEA